MKSSSNSDNNTAVKSLSESNLTSLVLTTSCLSRGKLCSIHIKHHIEQIKISIDGLVIPSGSIVQFIR